MIFIIVDMKRLKHCTVVGRMLLGLQDRKQLLMTSGNTGDFGGNLNEIHGQSFDKITGVPYKR